MLSVIISCFWALSQGYSDNLLVEWIVILYFLAVTILFGDAIVKFRKKRRFGYALLVFGSWFFFAYPAARIVAEPSVWFGDRVNFLLTSNDIILTVLHVTIFLLASVTAYAIFDKKYSLAKPQNKLQLDPNQLLIPLVVFFVLVVLPYVLLGGGLEETVKGILSSRSGIAAKGWKQTELLGDPISPIWVFSRPTLVAISAISLTLLLTQTHKLHARWLYLGMGAVSLVVVFFDTGTRSWFLLSTIPPVIIWSTMHSSRLGLRKLSILAVLAVVIFAFAQFQLRYRTAGNFSSLQITSESVLTIGDNDFFSETAVAILIVSVHGRVHENVPLLFLTNPVPRFLWTEKPTPETVRVYSLFRRGYDVLSRGGGNSMPSIVGQFYMSWGTFGVIVIGLFYGWAYRFADKVLDLGNNNKWWALVALTAMVWLWLGHRGLYPGFHYAFLVESVIILWAYQRKVLVKSRVSKPVLQLQDQETQTG